VTIHRTVFFASDRTGITAEALGLSLLTQFSGFHFHKRTLAFIDNREKALAAAAQIRQAGERDGQPALIFSTQVTDEYRDLLAASGGVMFDFFETFISKMEFTLHAKSSHAAGRSHGIHRESNYSSRINSINFALSNDDGATTKHYDEADIILTGVSRSGKTPTCLFLALQYGIHAANYPLIEEDLDTHKLPKILQQHREKLFGLTLAPVRLHKIRSERRSNSRYASLDQCQREVRRAEEIYYSNHIPYLDTSQVSIEEIASIILDRTGLKRRY
jgi:regulator of PEP synthase PpsR (kinase-PPPase family)